MRAPPGQCLPSRTRAPRHGAPDDGNSRQDEGPRHGAHGPAPPCARQALPADRRLRTIAPVGLSFRVTPWRLPIVTALMTPNSSPLALTRAKGFGSLPALLESQGGERALLQVFEAEGVPLGVLDAPSTPIPLSAMIGLFSRAARLTGNRTLGLDVGTVMSHRAYGSWIDYALGGATLGAGLRRACATIWTQQSGCRMELTGSGPRRLFSYRPPTLPGLDDRAHSDHTLPPILAFARAYLGSDWQPDWVELNYPRDADAGRLEEALGVPVRFGCPGVGIPLRTSLLDQPLRPEVMALRPPPVTLREVVADVLLCDAPEPARSLSAVVALRLLDGECDIDGAARMAGLGVQGLQRRLRQAGHTYRGVVDLARRARAASLLTETDMAVVDIALSLGYEDHANFTRAFGRWLGCSPSDFRRRRAPPRG